ncbi:MAG: cell division protein ZapA [bacterium]
MNEESGVLKINIYGTEYPIRSDPDTETDYIIKVAEYVDKKMREIDQGIQAKSSLKVAILAALNITDELFQERVKDKTASMMQTRISQLSEKLGQALDRTGLD